MKVFLPVKQDDSMICRSDPRRRIMSAVTRSLPGLWKRVKTGRMAAGIFLWEKVFPNTNSISFYRWSKIMK